MPCNLGVLVGIPWRFISANLRPQDPFPMIDKILEFSLRQRAIVLLGAVALLAAGLWSALHLPIDAVPDITGDRKSVV